MAVYGNFNANKKKGNKLLVVICCVAAMIFIAVCIIGIVAGSNGESMQHISAAVAENTQLKEQINELNAEISRLNEEIVSLGSQLEARPTAPPQMSEPPRATPSADNSSTGMINPREDRR